MIAELPALVVSFVELRAAFEPLHQGKRKWIDGLHDVWKQGSPSPDSRIFAPDGYDERKTQRGNQVTRLVLPLALAAWIVAVSSERGMPYTLSQALSLLAGEVDYGSGR